MKRDADFSGFLSQTMDLLGSAAAYAGAFVLVVGGVHSAGFVAGLADDEGAFFGLGGGITIDGTAGPAGVAFQISAAIVSVIAGYFLLVKLVETAGMRFDTRNRIWAYIGLSILSLLGIIVGFILLIIPGLILITRWCAAPGFLVGSGEGVTDALGASWRATEGHSWQIFFAGLVIFLIFGIVAAVFGAGSAFASTPVVTEIVAAFADAISSVLTAAFGVAVYSLVHTDRQELGDVFS
ncbi:hypothetical protein [Qipengyuania sp. JC766]|uniref:hypothetical protein n=1 Tax=Qipengyuania sp. JC766 TaxID=3232139 RepID=UPI003458755C